MTIIITLPDWFPRSRAMAWLDRVIKLCPVEPIDVSCSAHSFDELTELH